MNISEIVKNVFIILHTNFINILIYVFIITIFFVSLYFLKSNTLHKSHKFTAFINLISSFGAIALALTLLLTVIFRNTDIQVTSFQTYNDLFKGHSAVLQFFIDHPEMNYYYNDIYGKKYLNYIIPYKRNKELEAQFTAQIMNTVASAADYDYLFRNEYSEIKNIINERMKKIVGLHVKSKIFLENWHFLKKTIATSTIIAYMKDNLNV